MEALNRLAPRSSLNRDGIIGLLLVGLLFGGLMLASRRPVSSAIAAPCCGQGARMVAETPRYRNKETRRIEYNDDGLPTLIEITRDYTVA